MDEISREKCCGTCIWYNGDIRDKEAFCDDKENYVTVDHYCYRYGKANNFEEVEDGRN